MYTLKITVDFKFISLLISLSFTNTFGSAYHAVYMNGIHHVFTFIYQSSYWQVGRCHLNCPRNDLHRKYAQTYPVKYWNDHEQTSFLPLIIRKINRIFPLEQFCL